MRKILFDEQPIVVDKVLARKLGLNEAVVIQQVHYWLKINEKKNQNYIHNRYWTFNSLKEWHENNFDFWSLDTVKRTFSKLEKMGILLVDNFNKDRRDRTKWYSIDYEKLGELLSEEDADKNCNSKSANCTNAKAETLSSKSANCNSAKCTNAEGQIAPGKSAKCTNVKGQIAPTITRDYYTEITTEITEEGMNEEADGKNQTTKKQQLKKTDEQVYDDYEEAALHYFRKFGENTNILPYIREWVAVYGKELVIYVVDRLAEQDKKINNVIRWMEKALKSPEKYPPKISYKKNETDKKTDKNRHQEIFNALLMS